MLNPRPRFQIIRLVANPTSYSLSYFLNIGNNIDLLSTLNPETHRSAKISKHMITTMKGEKTHVVAERIEEAMGDLDPRA